MRLVELLLDYERFVSDNIAGDIAMAPSAVLIRLTRPVPLTSYEAM